MKFFINSASLPSTPHPSSGADAALDPSPAALAPAEVNMKLDPLYPRLADLGLILILGLFQFAAAEWATARQFCFQALMNLPGKRAATTATILGPRFPPRLGRMGFRLTPRDRRRLTFPGALGLFQSA